MSRWLAALLGSMVGVLLATGCGRPAEGVNPDLVLGDGHYPITTADPEAQALFDRGLTLYLAGHRGQAVRSFEAATEIDPACSMCWWGVALALGPSAERPAPVQRLREKAISAVGRAAELAPGGNPKERAFIEALGRRHGEKPQRRRGPLDLAYAAAMDELAGDHPDDALAVTLANEALWLVRDGPPRRPLRTLRDRLEPVLQREPNHIGALAQFAVLTAEMKPDEIALSTVDRLTEQPIDVGHLPYLAGRVYLRHGRYAEAAERFAAALAIDERTKLATSADPQDRLLFCAHAYALASARQFQGRPDEAIQAAVRAERAARSSGRRREAPEELEFYQTVSLPILVRFGRWDELFDRERPTGRGRYAEAMWLFSRAMALSSDKRPDESNRLRQEMVRLVNGGEASLASAPGGALLADIAYLAEALLSGEIAWQFGSPDRALKHFLRAAAIQGRFDRHLPLNLPIQPRNFSGAALLALGQPDKAALEYRIVLNRQPRNAWALLALSETLEAQGNAAKAGALREELASVWGEASYEPKDSRW